MTDPAQREARPDFADRRGMIGPYGVRYSWAYWVVILAAFALLVVDIFDDGALWNYLVIVLVAIAIVIQPGRDSRPASRRSHGVEAAPPGIALSLLGAHNAPLNPRSRVPGVSRDERAGAR